MQSFSVHPMLSTDNKTRTTDRIDRVAIIDFRKVGQKGLQNEDKVGQNFFFFKSGQSRTKKFEKEEKVG